MYFSRLQLNICFILLLAGISKRLHFYLSTKMYYYAGVSMSHKPSFFSNTTTRSVLLSNLINGIIPWDSNGTKLLLERKKIFYLHFCRTIYCLFTFFVIISVAHIRITRKRIVFCVCLNKN